MILEGIVTTLDASGRVNVAPMGPLVDREMQQVVLRPFKTAETYRNLQQRGEGVLHVVDDVWLLARAAIGPIEPPPETFPAENVNGVVLREACRWYEFRVREIDDRAERTRIDVDVVARGRLRDFFGFNRAKHAVVEAAILATRVGIVPIDEIQQEFRRLTVPVEKTGGEQEHRAFALLQAHVQRAARTETTGSTGDMRS